MMTASISLSGSAKFNISIGSLPVPEVCITIGAQTPDSDHAKPWWKERGDGGEDEHKGEGRKSYITAGHGDRTQDSRSNPYKARNIDPTRMCRGEHLKQNNTCTKPFVRVTTCLRLLPPNATFYRLIRFQTLSSATSPPSREAP